MDIRNILKDLVIEASEAAARKWSIGTFPKAVLEIPRDRKIADIATNIAMQMSRARKSPRPQELAEYIADTVKNGLRDKGLEACFDKIEARHPGFINFSFSNRYLFGAIEDIERAGEDFGKSDSGRGLKVLVEFVSANPTGPLSVAHGRQAAVGDAIANILQFSGYDVKREYYLNDEGNQIDLLGESIYSRYCELLGEEQPFPEQGYRGDYIYDIAKALIQRKDGALVEKTPEAIDEISNFGVEYIMNMIRSDLESFGVRFDAFFSQAGLSKSGKIEKAVERLKKKALVYEKAGAVWFASSKFGDDKDRVLIKSDGAYTYLTPDIAYHEEKFGRGFDWAIDLWGPDHHGYIPRMNAVNRAMGRGGEALSLLIVQLATISRGGKPVAMSTRQGEFITLREVMDEVGRDVARFFFLMRRRDSHLDFDLELAKKESMDNPVYYIQYAHARICGILKHKHENEQACGAKPDPSLLNSKEELSILRVLREFPYTIEWSAKGLEPQRLIFYLTDLASCFHQFYTRHRVISDNKDLTAARLLLVGCLKKVFSRSLSLLGISCPEEM